MYKRQVYIWGRDAIADVTESADKGYYLTKALLERTPEAVSYTHLVILLIILEM